MQSPLFSHLRFFLPQDLKEHQKLKALILNQGGQITFDPTEQEISYYVVDNQYQVRSCICGLEPCNFLTLPRHFVHNSGALDMVPK